MVPNSNPRYSSVANTAAFNMDGEYRLDAPLAVVERYSDPKDSSTGTVYKLVHFQAWLHRRPHFYLYNVYSPNCLLVRIGLASLCLPSENVSDRVQIVLTLLLSAIAYKIYVGDHLPRLSYITELDAYVTLCMATLAALAFGCFGAFLCAFDRHASLAGRSLPAWVLAPPVLAVLANANARGHVEQPRRLEQRRELLHGCASDLIVHVDENLERPDEVKRAAVRRERRVVRE